MSSSRKKGLTTIRRLEEIPEFRDEAEEHAFWASHELSDALWSQAEPLAPEELPPPRPATTPVVIHLDETTLRRLQVLARRRHKGKEALLSELIRERLDEEERHESRRRVARKSSSG
ncbi:MAG: ribbon-helix-helix protein, CopG family [Chloroflexi bacterium]|nr:ribbon-helix-helix protein, CopG family [Chloroflexota bacterium]